MSEKKLEDIFSLVEYSAQANNVLEIKIKDNNVQTLNISTFHVVTCKNILFIYINETFPTFKIDLGEKIEMKEYHLDITGDVLTLTITKRNLKEQINHFIRKHVSKLFFEKTLKIIFLKYHYNNSIISYLKTLKKKCLTGFQIFYLQRLKKKLLFSNFDKARNIIYCKKFFKYYKKKINNKEIQQKQQKKYIFMLLIDKILLMIQKKKKLEKKIEKAKSFHIQKIQNFFIFSLKKNIKKMKGLEECSDLFHIAKLKGIVFHIIRENYLHIKEIKKNISKYNEINFLFLEYLVKKSGNKENLFKIHKDEIAQVFTLIKQNHLKKKIIHKKLALICLKYSNFNKRKIFETEKKIRYFHKVYFQRRMKNFFSNTTIKIFNSKIGKNKQLLMKFTQKQNAIQFFFNKIANILSKKLKNLQMKIIWRKRVLKFLLFDFFNCLFISKKNNEKLIHKNVSNSFEIVSIRLSNKKKQFCIQNFKRIMDTSIFFKNIRLKKKNNKIMRLFRELKYKYIKKNYYGFLEKIKTKSIISKKLKLFRQKAFKMFFLQLNKHIRKKKWSFIADKTYQMNIIHKSIFILKNYKIFKKEKKIRNLFFTKNLKKKIIKHYFTSCLIKGFIINKGIRSIDAIQMNNGMLSFIKKGINNYERKKNYSNLKAMIKKKRIQNVISISNKEASIKKRTNKITKKNYFFQIWNLFVKKIKLKLQIMKLYRKKIRFFNYSSTILHLKKNIYQKNKKEKYSKIFFINFFLNKVKSRIKYKHFLNQKVTLFSLKLPFIFLKNKIKIRKITENIQIKYKNKIIIKNVISKIFLFSKLKKFIKSLTPIIKKIQKYFEFIFFNNLKINKSNKIFFKRKFKLNFSEFCKKTIISHKNKIANNKMITLLTKKHILKKIMVETLNSIKKQILLENIYKYIYAINLPLFIINCTLKSKNHKPVKKKNLNKNSNKMKKIYFSRFLTAAKLHIYSHKLNHLVILEKERQRKKRIYETLKYLCIEGEKHLVKKKIYYKDIREIFLQKKKNTINKQIKKQFIYKKIKNFIEIMKKEYKIQKKKKNLLLKIGLKYLKKYINNNKIKKIKNDLYSRVSNIFDIQIKKNFFKIYLKRMIFASSRKRDLKNNIFNILKENYLKSKEIKLYLKEAKKLS